MTDAVQAGPHIPKTYPCPLATALQGRAAFAPRRPFFGEGRPYKIVTEFVAAIEVKTFR
ncbi:hypothetical protein SAMN06295998_101480 [Primorskyibacter flagellatus]|uniref:Uncharacterized protein n=1 Tax=Primorskyibacter flagellatus TaxID=1387277 RepID=A0A1W1ZDI6_9RHOB|nr:hypothetical protein SAMN06295998_101480 [Primorskyibacter flagellatus]